MNAPMIPINPIDHVVMQIVWRLPLSETAGLEQLSALAPKEREIKMIQVLMEAARRDKSVRDLLARPGIVDGLRQRVRDYEQQEETQAEQLS